MFLARRTKTDADLPKRISIGRIDRCAPLPRLAHPKMITAQTTGWSPAHTEPHVYESPLLCRVCGAAAGGGTVFAMAAVGVCGCGTGRDSPHPGSACGDARRSAHNRDRRGKGAPGARLDPLCEGPRGNPEPARHRRGRVRMLLSR